MRERLIALLALGGRDRDRIATWLLSAYLGVAVAYWLPVLGRTPLAVLKIGTWGAAVGLVLLPAVLERRFRVPRGLLGPWGFAGVFLLTLPGLLRGRETGDLFLFLIDIGAGATFLWCFFDLARRGIDLKPIFRRAALMVCGLGGVAALWAASLIPDWTVPCDRLWAFDIRNGFGVRSTGWAIGLGLYLPALALLTGTAPPRNWPPWSVPVGIAAAAGLLVGSQFASAGRAGLLMSGITVLAFLVMRSSRRVGLFIIAGGLLLMFTVLDRTCFRHLSLPPPPVARAPAATVEVEEAEEEEAALVAEAADAEPAWWVPKVVRASAEPTRVTGYTRAVEAAQASGNTFNFVSGHRVRHFNIAFERIAQRPLFGHGWRQVLLRGYRGRVVEVHNLWLRWAVYAGLLAPLGFALLTFAVLAAAFRLWRRTRGTAEGDTARVLGLILVLGLIASMFEGSVLLGSFQLTALWWAAAGAAVGLEARKSARSGAGADSAVESPAAG